MARSVCGNCRFFAPFPRDDTPNPYRVQKVDRQYGECQRFPPRPLELRSGSMPPVVSAFPVLADNRWCGEWQVIRSGDVSRAPEGFLGVDEL